MKKKCSECGSKMQLKHGSTLDGIEYDFFKCKKCGEEILNLEQLRAVAEKYRKMKSLHAKLGKWGLSLGLRLPKDIVKKYRLSDKNEVLIIPEKNMIKIIPI